MLQATEPIAKRRMTQEPASASAAAPLCVDLLLCEELGDVDVLVGIINDGKNIMTTVVNGLTIKGSEVRMVVDPE